MVTNTFKKAVLAFAICISPLTALADIVVIANRDLPVTSMSKEEIYRIYLGKTKYLSNGAKVIPVDQRSGSAVRERFYSEIANKTESEMKSYWSRVIFTGQGYPPIQESDDSAVLDTVAKNSNCLGYIDRSALNDSVKVVYSLQ